MNFARAPWATSFKLNLCTLKRAQFSQSCRQAQEELSESPAPICFGNFALDIDSDLCLNISRASHAAFRYESMRVTESAPNKNLKVLFDKTYGYQVCSARVDFACHARVGGHP
jgi:hypothetical protein